VFLNQATGKSPEPADKYVCPTDFYAKADSSRPEVFAGNAFSSASDYNVPLEEKNGQMVITDETRIKKPSHVNCSYEQGAN